MFRKGALEPARILDEFALTMATVLAVLKAQTNLSAVLSRPSIGSRSIDLDANRNFAMAHARVSRTNL